MPIDVEQGSDDRRADLAAAFDKMETEETPPIKEETPPVVEEDEILDTEEEADETEEEVGTEGEETRERDEHGRFKPKEKIEEKAEEEPQAAKPPVEQTKPAAKPATPAYRPPQAWKPAVRELLAKLPPELHGIREEVDRREREMAQFVQQAAPDRQVAGKFRETINPFMAMLRSEGVTDPMEAVGALLSTAYRLRTGSDTQRALLIANMAKMYLPQGRAGIEALDAAMHHVYNGGERPADPNGGGQYRDPRVDELLARFGRAEAQATERLSETARQAVEEIKNEEFYQDVAPLMADLLESAANRGVKLTVRDAYRQACAATPEVARLLVQRRREAADNAQRSRQAITPKPAHAVKPEGGEPTSGGDMRADIEAAIQKHSRAGRG